MHKLILIFHENRALPDLERRWSQEFVPLVDALPGLRRVVVSRVEGGPAGAAPIRFLHELFFDHAQALSAAMQSPAGRAVGDCLVRITQNAPRTVTMLFAEHMEDEPQPSTPPASPAA